MELRFVRKLVSMSLRENSVSFNNDTLQQKYLITRGENGKVEYAEVWRDVPLIEDRTDD